MGGGGSSGTANSLSPELTDLISNYNNFAGPALKGLTGQLSGDFGSLLGDATTATSALGNFDALQPADIAALSTAGGAAVESAGRTSAAQSGGVPNQALQDKNLSITAGQQVGSTATQLGEVAATQNAGLKEATASGFQGLSGESLSGILQALGVQAGALGTGVQGQLGVANSQNQQQQEKNQGISSGFQGIGTFLGSALGGGAV